MPQPVPAIVPSPYTQLPQRLSYWLYATASAFEFTEKAKGAAAKITAAQSIKLKIL